MALFENNQIAIDSLPKAEEQTLNPISPKYFIIVLFITLIAYFILFGAVLLLKIFAEDEGIDEAITYIGFTLLVLCIITIVISYLGFKKRKYAIRQQDMTYSHGYLVNKTLTLPYNRIQHIEIARSFIARKLGLSTLKIYSAGQSGGDLSIKGLPKDIAEKQYAFLTEIINERL
ncbi:PH domain-containing protein [Winogradskyella sp.]|uniref:PH domain-containing protein n=1 Tax=Winogradskyella sp. TaxID=1883156 RepID=UPI003F6C91B3